jgi:feruloyl-CoA synthase
MESSRTLPAETIIRHGPDGTLYARSPHQLGPYPDKITERLDYWAGQAPDRAFLAERGADGGWLGVTYAETRTRARALAQALIDRRLSSDRPLVILSGNSIPHALLALAAMYAGIPYAPIAPAYSLLAREYSTLKALWRSLTPGLVFVEEGERYEPALSSVAHEGTEIVSASSTGSIGSTPFARLERTAATDSVDAAHSRVHGDTIAKILFTSGSTGRPKGVINTQRMLCANQEMLRTVLPMLAATPPVLCDWLPWNHTFGGNHNFGIVLYNGGTLYIDDGRPTPEEFETTIANLREIAPTAYFNVPRGYDLLAPRLRADRDLRSRFFSRLGMLFCAAAALRQQVADDLVAAACDARGERIPFVTGLGATESAPFALCTGDADFTGGRIGVPVPGVELKLAPAGGTLEGRLRGPSITPGYWRDDEMTRAAFDEEGFYKLGDALGLVDIADPSQGFVFEGRLSEDFKLSTGTWVRVGPLRAALVAHLGDLVHDVVIAGHARDFVGALIFPSDRASRRLGSARLRERVADLLTTFAKMRPGSSTAIRRAILLADPPAIDALEVTAKGSVNQKAVLANRAPLVEMLYAVSPSDLVIDTTEGRDVGKTYSDGPDAGHRH